MAKRNIKVALLILFLPWIASGEENLIGEIRILNLINGLELEKEQAEFIIEKAKVAEGIREEMREEISERCSESLHVFEEMKEVLAEGGQIPESLKRRVRQAQNETKGLKGYYDEEMKSISLEVKDKLHGFQIHAIEKYKPCLIPPKGGLRIGQAESTKGMEKLLARIREAPSEHYENRRELIAERMIEKGKRHLPKGFQIDEESERERILSLLEEARNLSDVDFSVKKKALAEKLKSGNSLPKHPVDAWVKIERFLLAPEVIPLLEVFVSSGRE